MSLPAEWRCVRNRGGAIIGLSTVAPPKPAHLSGLALSVKGPRKVIAGSIASYTIRVRNTRRGPRNRDISSLWHLRVQSNLIPFANEAKINIHVPRRVVRRLAELRHGRTMVLRIRIRVPGGAKQASIHPICLYSSAIADSARPTDGKSLLGGQSAPTKTQIVDRAAGRSCIR